MADQGLRTSIDTLDEPPPELEQYSPALSNIPSSPKLQVAECASGKSNEHILRKRLAVIELELAKCKLELQLVTGCTEGKQEPEFPSIELPVPGPSSQSQSNVAELKESSLQMPNSGADGEGLPQLLNLCMGLPKKEIPKFDGNPMSYWNFIRSFTSGVARYTADPANRLSYLIHYCEGDAREAIEHCTILDPEEGYTEALRILESEFGDAQTISRELIHAITEGPVIRSDDDKGLSKLALKMQACEMTLNQLNNSAKLRSDTTLGSIVRRLPNLMQAQWYDSAASIYKTKKTPSFANLTEFIRDKATAAKLQRRGSASINQATPGHSRSTKFTPTGKIFSIATNFSGAESAVLRPMPTRTCPKCSQCHYLDACGLFRALEPAARLKFVNDSALCNLCLKPNHKAEACRSRRFCGMNSCRLSHHPLLHTVSLNPAASPEPLESEACPSARINFHTNMKEIEETKVAMGVVPVTVVGPLGQRTVRGLLDSGSDSTLITEDLVHSLGMTRDPTTISMSTVNGKMSMKSDRVTFQVKLGEQNDTPLVVQAWTVTKLPSAGPSCFSKETLSHWDHLRDLELPTEGGSKISVLLGMNVPMAHWVLECRRGEPDDPYAVRTPLGWAVLGPVRQNRKASTLHTTCSENEVEQKIEQLYKREFSDDPSSRLAYSVSDKTALAKANDTLQLVDGHYQLALPWKEGCPNFPDNYVMAYHRLQTLKRKLQRDQDLHRAYQAVIDGYLESNYVEVVQLSKSDGKECWYLPHHPVFHPHKPGKVRVVFDCAAVWKSTSLNSQLLSGPDVVNRLFGVLMRFRRAYFVAKADVEAMFHQVGVSEYDRRYLRFLWWRNGDFNDQLITLQMKVHPFGVTSSPFCASLALQRALTDNGHLFSDGTKVEEAVRAFYVDDFLLSCDSEIVLRTYITSVRNALAAGGFRLTKWSSNDPSLLSGLPESELDDNASSLDLPSDGMNRTLGLRWNMTTDTLHFDVRPFQGTATRRSMLSYLASLYDPLGLVSPVLIPAKLLFQELCRVRKDWDDELDSQMEQRWYQWLEGIAILGKIQVPRCLRMAVSASPCTFELHCFSDASERAYGAVNYLRMIDKTGIPSVMLLCSKARVAPLRSVTIPRLELTAAVVSARMALQLREELLLNPIETTFWTDSMVVLQMIRNRTTRFDTFVANRISTIHELSEVCQWKYVNTKTNPADLTSRGVSVAQLNSSLWFDGPEFLKLPESHWPKEPSSVDRTLDVDSSPEPVATVTHTATRGAFIDCFSRYGDWMKLLRAIAWIRRFCKWLGVRQTMLDTDRTPRVSELKEAATIVIRLTQEAVFQTEMHELSNPRQTTGSRSLKSTASPLARLSPFVADGLLRVGGRLRWASLPYEAKHPLLLPKSHFITTLVVHHYHQKLGHVGLNQVLASIRERYWIIQGRSVVNRIIRSCSHCARWFSKPCEQVMAPLPIDRTSSNLKPFSNVGVDYFGPILVKRGRGSEKRYGCVFTCLAIRAVHIEIAHSLDTDSFLCAFTRFVARRGNPLRLYSDNGTNFRGAERQVTACMRSWDQERIVRKLLQHECDWVFSPPKASHRGGIWERMIRSIRRILQAILTEQLVNDETLLTVMSEVEKILNDRPLTKLSDDPSDPSALTPSHLLLLKGNPTADVPREEAQQTAAGLVRRWKRANHLADVFWRRWLREYLPELQKVTRWIARHRDLQVGDMVLLVDQNATRGSWAKGVVHNIRQSRDGAVREAVLRTKNGYVRRDVRQLCLLEATKLPENPERGGNVDSPCNQVDKD